MIRLICKISCFAGKLNHQISSGKQSQISRKFTPEMHDIVMVTFAGKQSQISRNFTPEMHDIVMVTFAGKLNHVCSLLKPRLKP